MKPGTYEMVLYKGELAVGSQSVVVTAGQTVTSNINDANSADVNIPAYIWQIGEFDGRPTGFLNAEYICLLIVRTLRAESTL
jgi:rhamnogalacturonan endolyase